MPRVTGVTVLAEVSVSAKTKSLQANKKLNSAAVMIPLRLTGTTTDRKIRSELAPSTRAASMISPGMLAMKERMSRIENGMPRDASASTRPGMEFSKCSELYVWYSELAITMPGIIWVIKVDMSTGRVLRPGNFASAYAAGAATTIA